MSTEPTPLSSGTSSRWSVLAILLLVLFIGVRLPNLGSPLLGRHDFRQTQTMLTAYWFAQDGVSLPDYPLPVFGAPWTAPFEFPLFQFIAAAVHRTGVPLDLSGQIVALLFFFACVLLFLRLARKLELGPYTCSILLIFCGLSPFALVWSRATLVDFSSVTFAVAFLGTCLDAYERHWTLKRFVAAVILGVFAALTKITTLPVFLPAVFALAVADSIKNWRATNADTKHCYKAAFIWAAILTVPLICGAVWTAATDVIKAQSPFTANLTSSALQSWNFGTFAQRLSPENWQVLGQRISHWVIPWSWPFTLLGLASMASSTRPQQLVVGGLFLGGLLTPVVFFNLYVVHDYYLCAIVFPVWLVTARGVTTAIASLSMKARAWAIIGAIVIYACTSLNAPYALSAYIDHSNHEVYQFAIAARGKIPAGAEVVVFGEDWNPRIPYYLQCKAMMVRPGMVSESDAVRYASRHHVRHVVAVGVARAQINALWPSACTVLEYPSYTLYSLPKGKGKLD